MGYVGVKCNDDISEQRILTAPAITLSDNRAVYDAKCGRPQRADGGWSNADRHLRTEGGGIKWVIFADVLYGRPLSRFQLI